jgi:hypothetical protein
VPTRFVEVPDVNENLCRALLSARLSEDDVAAQLQVDPKTVRRWLDGRVPYLQHRWALAALTGMDEGDLWPQVRAGRSRPAEVVALYPHRDDVPPEAWLRMLAGARREITILDSGAVFLAGLPGITAILAARAGAGARVRICLADPDKPDIAELGTFVDPAGATAGRAALEVLEQLLVSENIAIRLHQAVLPSSMCRADAEMLVCQRAHGIAPGRSPVLRLQQAGTGDMATAYLDSFEAIWAGASPFQ